uniref:Uncharacterized protein n=1 Tax=Anguilla anguilla TaxID=7936 RepID=A0A0E9WTM3_ANGAN
MVIYKKKTKFALKSLLILLYCVNLNSTGKPILSNQKEKRKKNIDA